LTKIKFKTRIDRESPTAIQLVRLNPSFLETHSIVTHSIVEEKEVKKRRQDNPEASTPSIGTDAMTRNPPQPRKPTSLFFEVGNTNPKNHGRGSNGEWSVFVDVVSGNPELIAAVKFEVPGQQDGSTTTKLRSVACPITVQLPGEHGEVPAKRFAVKVPGGKAASQCPIKIKIVGGGGTGRKFKHKLQAASSKGRPPNETRSRPFLFQEYRSLRPKRFNPMPAIQFGIELELSCKQSTPRENVASNIAARAGVPAKAVIGRDKSPYDGWKLEDDNSIACSLGSPDCSKFELVSPILCGGPGAQECRRVLTAVQEISSIQVNKSMGFHVHVSVEHLPLGSLKNICQNHIKYESVIDTFMAHSRRQSNSQYAQSNQSVVPGNTHGEKHQAIARCKSIAELVNVMNPVGSRYYKLNLRHLVTGRQPTMEFRQHSATCKYEKIMAWVRFCLTLVHQSIHQPRPSALKGSAAFSLKEQFELLFEQVIQDRKLQEYYSKRRLELEEAHEKGAAKPAPCKCQNHATPQDNIWLTKAGVTVATAPLCQCRHG
jgi:hypothetical protein